MNTGKEKTYVQCQSCGHIYYIEKSIPINKLYVASACPGCGEYTKGLNCGNTAEDLYLYMNTNVDPRYFKY